MVKCIFDLDGTLTTVESLPFIAQHFHITKPMAEMTLKTVQGDISFEESLRHRVGILKKLPVDAVSHVLATIPLHTKIQSFINTYAQDCLIATANMDVWLVELAKSFACSMQSSKACVKDNGIVGIEHILCKKDVVQAWQKKNHKVIFVGDGENDVQAMHCADVAIAVGIGHTLTPQVQNAADYMVYEEESFHALLCDLYMSWAS